MSFMNYCEYCSKDIVGEPAVIGKQYVWCSHEHFVRWATEPDEDDEMFA